MKTLSLYLTLWLGVLAAVGCGSPPDERNTSVTTGAEADTATAAPPNDAPAEGERTDAVRVLVLGNSITAGYGLDEEEAFPAVLQRRVDSLGWNVEIVPAGVSGATSAEGARRIEWLLRDPVDVLVLELGGNDGLRGIAPEVTRRNLAQIIETTRRAYPEAAIVLAGMQIPPNLGQSYTEAFRDLYPELAAEKDAHLIPFILEGVGGIRDLNLPDGIHPTAEGHRIVADNVWEILRPILESEHS